MVDSYLLTKLGIDSVKGFWENAFYGWTDDGRPPHGISSADTVKQSYKHILRQVPAFCGSWRTDNVNETHCGTWSEITQFI